MITFALMNFFVDLLGLVLGAVDLPGPPQWAITPGASMGIVFQALGSMAIWFNVPLVGMVVTAAFAARLAGLGIKVARMFLSLFTGGGGNAGP